MHSTEARQVAADHVDAARAVADQAPPLPPSAVQALRAARIPVAAR